MSHRKDEPAPESSDRVTVGKGEPTETPLAGILNRLLDLKRRDDGKVYSDRQVAEWCQENCENGFSHTYFWMLRTGRRENLLTAHAHAIAAFFDVDAEWITTPSKAVRAITQLDLAIALRDSNVKDLALRGSELSPEGLAAVLAYADEVHQSEQAGDES